MIQTSEKSTINMVKKVSKLVAIPIISKTDLVVDLRSTEDSLEVGKVTNLRRSKPRSSSETYSEIWEEDFHLVAEMAQVEGVVPAQDDDREV